MPKPWDAHKAEIERLYIQQHLPLKDVKKVMETHHQLNASIRAYRMKLDEWGFQKNKRQKNFQKRYREKGISLPLESDLSDSSSKIPTLNVSLLKAPERLLGRAQTTGQALESEVKTAALLSPGFDMGIYTTYKIRIPKRSLSAAETLELIPPEHRKLGLEIMLLKWVTDSDFLPVAIAFIRNAPVDFKIMRRDRVVEGNVFKMIESRLPLSEGIPLTKALLSCVKWSWFDSRDRFHARFIFWSQGLKFPRWSLVRDTFGQPSLEISLFGVVFVKCNQICLAEGRLLVLKKVIEGIWDCKNSLHPSHRGISSFLTVPADVNHYIAEYLEILADFEESESYDDLDVSHYKFCATIVRWNLKKSSLEVRTAHEP